MLINYNNIFLSQRCLSFAYSINLYIQHTRIRTQTVWHWPHQRAPLKLDENAISVVVAEQNEDRGRMFGECAVRNSDMMDKPSGELYNFYIYIVQVEL